MNIAIIGTGYVGLVVGACFADFGNNVLCTDKDYKKINDLTNGIVPIYEPKLEDIIKRNLQAGRLNFTQDTTEAVKFADICIIAVNTPQKDDGSADIQAVYDVSEQIGKSLNGYKVIVNKSTCPVGTAENISRIIKSNTDKDFDVVSNPEFLKQGDAVNDFLNPERIIIGSESQKAVEVMKNLYSSISLPLDKFILMDNKSAEMTKYAANSFLATKISFINEITNLCEKTGANPLLVKKGISSDSRIGDKFLNAGLGYGGSCFPKDVNALIRTGEKCGYKMNILEAVDKVNINQRQIFLNKILNRFGKDLKGKKFGVWGLAFKPETNDMRQAPSVTIIDELLKCGAGIVVFDPKALENCKNIYGDKITYAKNLSDVLENADALLILTEWKDFLHPDFTKIKSLMNTPVIFDGRNIYDPEELKSLGFEYFSLGR